MTQADAIELAKIICCRTDQERNLVQALYRRAGVRERRTALPHTIAYQWLRVPVATGDGSVLPDDEPTACVGPTTAERMAFYREHAPILAVQAAAKALAESGVAPGDITHVVTVTCTGFDAPGVDVALIEQLGLRSTTERIQVGFMGCHGAVNGIRAALPLVEADPSRRVLLCAVELCSLHFSFTWDPARAVGNAVFADGAAALVLGSETDDRPGEAPRWHPRATGSCLIPNSTDAMSWSIGDHGFEMVLSPRVPDLIAAHLRPWLEDWLAGHGLTLAEIGSWAVHPGGPRIVSAVEKSLGLDASATAVSREVLAECGNMSSPTILFILERLTRSQAKRPCVALGFGPGLTAEAALFD